MIIPPHLCTYCYFSQIVEAINSLVSVMSGTKNFRNEKDEKDGNNGQGNHHLPEGEPTVTAPADGSFHNQAFRFDRVSVSLPGPGVNPARAVPMSAHPKFGVPASAGRACEGERPVTVSTPLAQLGTPPAEAGTPNLRLRPAALGEPRLQNRNDGQRSGSGKPDTWFRKSQRAQIGVA